MSILKLHTGNDGTKSYPEYLRDKVAFDRTFGFDVRDEWLSPIMRHGHPNFTPHQADTVTWAAKWGRSAIFARVGVGAASHIHLTPRTALRVWRSEVVMW